MTKTTLQLETLTCPSCVRRIEGTVGKHPGVHSAIVKFNASKVEIEHEVAISSEDLQNMVMKLGYKVLNVKK